MPRTDQFDTSKEADRSFKLLALTKRVDALESTIIKHVELATGKKHIIVDGESRYVESDQLQPMSPVVSGLQGLTDDDITPTVMMDTLVSLLTKINRKIDKITSEHGPSDGGVEARS